ncbi:MAG: UvrABC system protein A [Candidatus Poribacteria bacterium]|nr:MAG: UvrABC system protein A [Candidatus Poribacteria bacterium]
MSQKTTAKTNGAEVLSIRGAREHNLQNVDLDLPKNALICFTGVSGSGKSSLAFDTLYAEGQRRYIESLSAYARQFLGPMEKPDVDFIGGLAPTISIDQKSVGHNPRSTVATITEIYDYLRLLFARIGRMRCLECGGEVGSQTLDEIVDRILSLPEGTRFQLLAPVVRGRKGEYREELADALRMGFARARIDGQLFELTETIELDRNRRHDIEIVVDRIVLREGVRSRVAESVETALSLSGGLVLVDLLNGEELLFSQQFTCKSCGVSYEEPSPQLFSFNSPKGMCPTCRGLGGTLQASPERIITDPNRSIREGAIGPWGAIKDHHPRAMAIAEHLGFSLDTPWKDLPEEVRRAVLYGIPGRIPHRVLRDGRWVTERWRYPGVVRQIERYYFEGESDRLRRHFERYMAMTPCPECRGTRLRREASAITVAGKTIFDVTAMSIEEAYHFFEELPLTRREAQIAELVLKEIRSRLWFLKNVGLDYLSLDRTAPTLSGGESQRIRLASQIGTGLVGVLYILDEPSIGLHARDNQKLLDTLKKLRDLGNTILIVEHDEETMWASDYLVDFGPGAGRLGGKVVAQGPPEAVAQNPHSLTGQYLSRRRRIPVPERRRAPSDRWLVVRGARHNNLKNVDVAFPLGTFICVTGVSGSGKSSLVNDILHRALARDLMGAEAEPGEHDRIEGIQHLDKVIAIDQSPIGRTPRSNPATYVKVFDEIRALYASLPESQVRGYRPGRFSFNVRGGRCEACEGYGYKRIEMQLLADVWVKCDVCQGRRFNAETLEVRYKGKNIADVLEMDAQEALEHFGDHPSIARRLQTLCDVGLDYIHLGQPAPTLSGGEAQRVKLARELGKVATGRTLYILDEPTTGLHFEDVRKLLEVLHRLVDLGNTVVVIEHNMEVIKTADYIIDLGPEGGDAGGWLVVTGTPEEVAAYDGEPPSATAQVLRRVLARESTPIEPAKGPPPERLPASVPRGEPIREIRVRGAREHNLKNLSVDIPQRQLVAFTGVSGSGKTSLALDTLYAEGQRRYVESLSAYARQFLGRMEKPRVEHIEGLSPAIAIDQKAPSRSPRSTVGTVTEIYDYLRVLFARVGTPHCPECGRPIGTQTADQIVERILSLPVGSRLHVLAPLQLRRNETYEQAFERARGSGYARVWINGRVEELEPLPSLDRRIRHEVALVVDRLVLRPEDRSRLAEAVEAALAESGGLVRIEGTFRDPERGTEETISETFSEHFACVSCGLSFEPLTPQHFSYNHSVGRCPRCEGLGEVMGVHPERVVNFPKRSLRAGAIAWWGPITASHPLAPLLSALAREYGFSLTTPFAKLPDPVKETILYGTDRPLLVEGVLVRFRGAVGTLDWLHTRGAFSREIRPFLDHVPCPVCRGSRLQPLALAVRIEGKNIVEVTRMTVEEAALYFQTVRFSGAQEQIAQELLNEIRNRLQFLLDVGLGYLTLDRPAPTLSGGEAQRIRLAAQLGSGLTGVLYVLDEPTIGLHPRDNARLLKALARLRDLGNTVIVVEHDEETIRTADHVLDFGPRAGVHGGRIVAQGTPEEIAAHADSLTGRYLSRRESIPTPPTRRTAREGKCLELLGASHNNLKHIDVKIPLGTFVCVTGVSGSGKSSLVEETLYPLLANRLSGANLPVGAYREVRGIEALDKVINVDQKPIGETPRSSPATYTDVFTDIRRVFAELPEAQARGYDPSRFTANLRAGQCYACQGYGYTRIEMQFLPDVWIECEVCNGTGFNRETLEVRYKGKNIAEVLQMDVSEAIEHFRNFPTIVRKLQTLVDVGLDYIRLGQPAPTLSGGEAQRIKLARELSRRSTEGTIYLLDEPTTGLHFEDIKKLLAVLHRLVDQGSTVVVVEHNLHVIASADYVIDLGPEGGEAGGYIVAEGTPEQIAKVERSHTGRYLRPLLGL